MASSVAGWTACNVIVPEPQVDYATGNRFRRPPRYAEPMIQTSVRPVGDHLRSWRQRRRMSQLDLALEAQISQKHLSFVESGRSSPSREMVLTLAERLDLPLRERNVLLHAAGYAPIFPERSLDDPALKAARAAVDLVLKGHEPFPALAVDRHWRLVAANAAVAPLLADVGDPALLQPPMNVLRLSLHPQGLAPRIANLPEWRAHLLERLRHQIDVTGDAVLARLMRELSGYPETNDSTAATRVPAADYAGVVVPLRLATDGGVLSFFSTTTVFGTPVDVTLSELAIEAFFPADEATAQALRASSPTSSASSRHLGNPSVSG
jgi:transcriptional regulator with XRE-family HTH domain